MALNYHLNLNNCGTCPILLQELQRWSGNIENQISDLSEKMDELNLEEIRDRILRLEHVIGDLTARPAVEIQE